MWHYSMPKLCRATGSKLLGCDMVGIRMVHRWISHRVLRVATYDPGH
jgi:hypothetical protein